MDVYELTLRNALQRSYDIFHVHWPDLRPAQAGWLRALVWSVSFLVNVVWMKARGARVVWTIHNVQPHDLRHPRLTRWFWRCFLGLLDGYFCLSETGAEVALQHHPPLARLPGFITPHGHYRDVFPDPVSRERARIALGLDDGPVTAFVGRIRRYKNVVELVKVFRQVEDRGATLLVGGEPEDSILASELRKAAEGDERVRLDLRLLPDEEIEKILRASDLAVFPFVETLHSGSAILALSLDTPVLVPDVGALPELQVIAGEEWVRTYGGDLDTDLLERAMAWARRAPRDDRPPLDALGWDRIADATLAGYQRIIASRGGS